MNRLIVALWALLVLAGCASTSGGDRSERSARVHTELAAMYYQRGQYGVALEEIRMALEADSGYSQAYGVRGLVHMALSEDKAAEEDFRTGLRLDGLNANLHNNYGWFLCQRGREKESIPHFMSALKDPLYKTPGLAFLNAGLCSRQMGSNKEAEEYLIKSLQMQPDIPRSLITLADMSYEKGDYRAARDYFSRFSAVDKNMTAEQLWLGIRIQRKVGNRNAEASYGIQLRKRFPDAKETRMLMRGE